jgi:hypothetical protein
MAQLVWGGASAVSLQTYWLVVPLAGIGLSAFGWLALWLSRRQRAKQDQQHANRQGSLHLTA